MPEKAACGIPGTAGAAEQPLPRFANFSFRNLGCPESASLHSTRRHPPFDQALSANGSIRGAKFVLSGCCSQRFSEHRNYG